MNANAGPVMFSAALACNHVQLGELDLWSPLFQQDIISTEAELVVPNTRDALDLSQGAPQAKRRGYSNPWKNIVGVDKRCLHRLVEKERRKDMKSRYSKLRSLLPEGYITENASMPDQLSEAIGYIHHLQEKIDKLAKKRDEMEIEKREEKICTTLAFHKLEAFPLVNVTHAGSRVLVTTNTFKDQIVLSMLLLAIEDVGLQVLSAVSSATDHKVFNTVHCEVSDMHRFSDAAKLHQKIWQLIRENSVADVYVPAVQI